MDVEVWVVTGNIVKSTFLPDIGICDPSKA